MRKSSGARRARNTYHRCDITSPSGRSALFGLCKNLRRNTSHGNGKEIDIYIYITPRGITAFRGEKRDAILSGARSVTRCSGYEIPCTRCDSRSRKNRDHRAVICAPTKERRSVVTIKIGKTVLVRAARNGTSEDVAHPYVS